MRRSTRTLALAFAFITLSATYNTADACTNLIVTKGASTDGSVICTYNCDTFGYSGWLTHSAAGRHGKGELVAIRSFWHPAEIRGYVEQAEYTYNVVISTSTSSASSRPPSGEGRNW